MVVGDSDATLAIFSAPGIVIGHSKRGCVFWKSLRKPGEDHEVTFDRQPDGHGVLFRCPEGDAANPQNRREAFIESFGKASVGGMKEDSCSLAAFGEEEGLLYGSHPHAGAHLVGHADEVLSAHALSGVPAGAFGIEIRSLFTIGLDNPDDFLSVTVAFELSDRSLPLFTARAEGVQEARGATCIPTGAELVDRRGVAHGGGDPTFLGMKGEEENEKKSELKDHCSGG